jgi:hypothetical protein
LGFGIGILDFLILQFLKPLLVETLTKALHFIEAKEMVEYENYLSSNWRHSQSCLEEKN